MRIYAGFPMQKAPYYYTRENSKEKEEFFESHFSGVHVYATGQLYILSYDLAKGAAYAQAHDPKAEIYVEQIEDMDIGMLVFLVIRNEPDHPIKLVVIHNALFWKHEVKLKYGLSTWKKTWKNEIEIMRTKYCRNTKIETSRSAKNRTTIVSSMIPVVANELRIEWRKSFDELNFIDALNYIEQHKLDIVQINNSIALPEMCFLNTGYLTKPLSVIQFNANGGSHWFAFASLVKEQFGFPDIVILNEMDIGLSRSENVHTVELLAKELGLNYVWNLETIHLNVTINNNHGLTGQAILSNCMLFDPLILRDKPSAPNLIESQSLTAPSGLLVRMGSEEAFVGNGNYLVAGSLHNIDTLLQKSVILDYLYGPNEIHYRGRVIPWDQIGSIIAGNASSEICHEIGLENMDEIKYTYPVSCHGDGSLGTQRADHICSNLYRPEKKKEHVILPCYTNDTVEVNSQKIRMSTHSILFNELH